MLRILLILVHHVDLDLAERAREGDLRGGRQVDVAEENQLVVEERLVDLVEHLRLDRLRQRDAGDLAAERVMQRLDLKRPVAARLFALGLGPSSSSGFALSEPIAWPRGKKAASRNFHAWLH